MLVITQPVSLPITKQVRKNNIHIKITLSSLYLRRESSLVQSSFLELGIRSPSCLASPMWVETVVQTGDTEGKRQTRYLTS